MSRVFLCALILSLAGCAVSKQWTATGGSRADAIVRLSYEYGEFEAPEISINEGVPLAKKRCAAWGYSNAEPFGGQTKSCNRSGGFGGCSSWMVTVEYQCLE